VGRPYQGGTLATGGGIVFQGTTSGYFKAYDAATGKQLLSYYVGSGILGAPSTVEIDGQQMVLVAVGSGSTSAVVFAKDFLDYSSGPPRLLAFSLEGKARLPRMAATQAEKMPKPAASREDAALVRRGRQIWDSNGCELCHGVSAIGGMGSIPDVRRINSDRLALLDQIVRGGLFKANGMPVFAESIKPEDIPALRAFIVEKAWVAYEEQVGIRKTKNAL
jgi:mono/diheme cytochrome c family protein